MTVGSNINQDRDLIGMRPDCLVELLVLKWISGSVFRDGPDTVGMSAMLSLRQNKLTSWTCVPRGPWTEQWLCLSGAARSSVETDT